jgi:hypothetical protein
MADARRRGKGRGPVHLESGRQRRAIGLSMVQVQGSREVA